MMEFITLCVIYGSAVIILGIVSFLLIKPVDEDLSGLKKHNEETEKMLAEWKIKLDEFYAHLKEVNKQ